MLERKLKDMKKTLLFTALLGILLTGCASGGSDDNTVLSENASSEDSFTSSSSSSEVESSLQSSSEAHEHTFNNETWEFDTEHHWHPSTCGHDVTTTPIAHSFKDDVIKPTYESGGYTVYTCTVCGYSYKADITDKLEHNYSPKWTYDSETHWHACQDEGYESLKSGEEIHSWDKKITEPTTESKGYSTYFCIVCGYSYNDEYTPRLVYTITWKNYDGTILETDTEVPYGTTPTYDGITPTKGSDDQYSYTFSGWSPEVTEVTRDATYTAQFNASVNEYTVTWKNYDGTVLETDQTGYGTTPTYDGDAPTKPGDDLHYYTFSGWSPSVAEVTGDTTYTARFTENNMFVLELSSDGEEYTVTRLMGDELAEVTVPAYINDIPVTRIGDNAFKDKSLRSVVISNGITAIGKEAFYGCSLSSISMPDTLLTIGDNAFSYCSLKSVTVPDSVVNIGEAAFSGCSRLDTISLPFIGESVSSDETLEYIFTKYPSDGSYIPSSLKKVILSASCTSITENDFKGCTNLTTVEINGKDTTISGHPFKKCSTLKAVVFGPNITKISDGAFYGVETLKSVSMSDNVVSIGGSAFNGCSLTSIHLSKSLLTLGKYAFSKTSLISIEFPDLVENIANYSFSECEDLVEIKFGANVSSIGEYAFYHCASLRSLTIPSSIRTIGPNAFNDCSSLESLVFEEGVTTIGGAAFYNCAIKSLVLPDSLTTLSKTYTGAFENCVYLKTVKMGAGCGGPSDYLFSGCSSLATFTATSISFVGSYGFSGCTSLTSLVIDGEGGGIGSYAFNGCSSLNSLTISGYVFTVGSYAFNGCNLLTELSFPDGLTSLGSKAFSGAPSLRKITLPGTFAPSSWYLDWFDNCPLLEEINMEQPSEDGWYTNDGLFYYSNMLVKCPEGKKAACVELPDGIDGPFENGGNGFKNCTGIESVVLPERFTSHSTFAGCTALTKVFWKGTDISKSPFDEDGNDKNLLSSKLYYYSETEPSAEGQYWHYVDDVPTVW